jgi:osmotically-inducible protein OsmY
MEEMREVLKPRMADLSQDEQLRQEVLNALQSKGLLDVSGLRVGVLDGIVHLAGDASSRAAWEAVEQIVSSVNGVRGVVNRIQAPGAPSPSRTIQLEFDEKEPKIK